MRLPTRIATQGSPFSFQFAANTFSDVDGDPLTYTATLDPMLRCRPGCTLTATTRTFSGTPTNADVGTIAVKVTASDGTLSVSDTFNIAVGNTNDAPVIQGVGGTVTVAEDNPVLLQAQSAQVTDADGDTLTMTLGVSGGRLTPSQAILDAIASHALASSRQRRHRRHLVGDGLGGGDHGGDPGGDHLCAECQRQRSWTRLMWRLPMARPQQPLLSPSTLRR